MKKLLIITAALLALSACRTVVVDQENAPVGVPTPPRPNIEQIDVGNDPYRRTFDTKQTIPRGSRRTVKIDTDLVDQQFQEAYEKAGRPRMIVYLNRELSSEVREWRDTDRTFIDRDREGVSVYGEPFSDDNDITIVDQDDLTGDGSRRGNPREEWMFSFEDGTLEPLVRNGAIAVDRAIALRQSSPTGKRDIQSPKAVEVDALRGYADVLLEILITRGRNPDLPYEFKISVKEVESGRILGVASSSRWSEDYLFDSVEFTGSRGYDLEEEMDMPPPFLVGELLSYQVMDLMAATWAR